MHFGTPVMTPLGPGWFLRSVSHGSRIVVQMEGGKRIKHLAVLVHSLVEEL